MPPLRNRSSFRGRQSTSLRGHRRSNAIRESPDLSDDASFQSTVLQEYERGRISRQHYEEVHDANPQAVSAHSVDSNYLSGFIRAQLDASVHADEQDLICSICQELFRDPINLVCGHIFCQSCITLAYRERNQCPNCSEPFGLGDFRPITVLKNYINSMGIKCADCDWKGKIEQFRVHELSCANRQSV
jgi:hypothetical protein